MNKNSLVRAVAIPRHFSTDVTTDIGIRQEFATNHMSIYTYRLAHTEYNYTHSIKCLYDSACLYVFVILMIFTSCSILIFLASCGMKIITACQYFHRMMMGRLCRHSEFFCSRQIKPWPSEMAITISTSHPFRCLCLTQEKDQCHQSQWESIDSACNFVCSNLNYCLKRSSLGPLSQPTALIKPTTMEVWNFWSVSRYLCSFVSGALVHTPRSLVRSH